MSGRERLLFRCSAILTACAGMAFALLTTLHAHLDTPWVRRFDLGVQARVHEGMNPALTPVMETLTFIGSIEAFIPTLIVAVALLLWKGEREQGQRLVRKRQVSTIFAIAIGGALALDEFLKNHFHRARPKVPWSIGKEPTFSFPSGHSLFSCVLYALIASMVLERKASLWKRILVIAVAAGMTLAIGVSRIYLGMHWPTDVVAGYITGGLWVGGVMLVDRMWRVSRKIPLITPSEKGRRAVAR